MQHFRSVPAAAQGLNDGPFLRMESVLSDILDKLFFAFDATKTLRAGVADLDRLLEPENLVRINEKQATIAQLMDQIDANSKDAKAFVQDLRDNGRKMSSTLKELSKIIQSSNIVSLNARIIAQSHRHRALGAQLVRLAESISDISGDATNLVSEMFEVIDTIVTTTEEMGQNVEERARALFSTLKPKAKALEAALTALEKGMKAASTASSWLSEYVAVAEKDVSEVISALQVGDRSRQRAEHVRFISERAALYHPHSTEATSLMLLARAQMQETVTETITDTRKARQLFASLSNRQHDFLARCREIAGSFEDSALALAAAARPIDSKAFDFAANAEAEERVQARLQEADGALAVRSKTLSDNAFQMQLAALNTIITCARGFKQAMDMIMISQQINEVISEAPVTFEKFAETMELTKTKMQAWSAREAEGGEGHDLSSMEGEDPALQQAREVLEKLLPSLENDAPQIANAITSSADAFESFVEELELLDQVEKVALAPLPLEDAIISEEFTTHLAEIHKCYTMQAERDIQDVMFSQLKGDESEETKEEVAAAPEPTAASDDVDDLDDIFF
ncbi:hypothetical protein TL5118_01112 [Thalassovita autumnalis]|uniref:Methyl-accepting transducer domain-containing protein n=1 Tax=Thalassovita autumnalis TaxID=2072972 RepID=A0A0N7LV13_9RHOB|nr:hypothetical protein [Thalassovita autumnalis]CUH65018.1 hypothetical protein TL5118_01112 [Thalassovita autumnalis]CUH71142.1 hypothetical protein TL5120_00923 [Thalassovita autumnalis]